MRLRVLACAVALCVIHVSPARDAVAGVVVELAPRPGENVSFGYGVSGNGSFATGTSNSNPMRWTSSGASEFLGYPAGSLTSSPAASPVAANTDGSVVVGATQTSGGARAARWRPGIGSQILGELPGSTSSQATAVSGDGARIVGNSPGPQGNRAFLWTEGGGLQSIGTLPNGFSSTAADISRDGQVIVGASGTPAGVFAYRWTESGGMVNLGTLPGFVSSESRASNADGSVVVGFSRNQSQAVRATRWTATTGMQDLGLLQGATGAMASDVNAVGDVIVGSYFVNQSAGGFYWTPSLGMVSLNSYLGQLGFDLTGWSLYEPRAISDDGSVIVGNGLYNGRLRGFMVVGVPGPSSGAILLAFAWHASRRRRSRWVV